MIAILGGLAAGLCWSATGLCAQRASRMMGELATFAWGSGLGLLIIAGPATVSLILSPPSGSTMLALGLGGVLNVAGLLAQFSALRRGRVSVIVPITSAEGAVAGLCAVADGAHLALAGWIALAAIIAGILVTVVSQRSTSASEEPGPDAVAITLAVFAAVAFGAGLFFQGHAGRTAPFGLAVVPPSLAGTIIVALPLAARGRLPRSPRALRWAAGVAVAEVAGFACYVAGARESVPVAAVLSSQYATFSVAVGVIVLRERFSRMQLVGFLLTIGGVTLLSALS